MISNYEKQYMGILKDIYENGFSDGTNERTGYETKRLPGAVIRVDVEKEFPILKSKFVAGKTAQREIEWIWKYQTNNIHALKAKIWDQWADKDGSIGTAYGYQVAQPVEIYTDPIHKTLESFRGYDSQADFVLEYLKEFPNGRWCVTSLWNRQELKGMNLVPCCHTSTWNLDGGRLNCLLDQRSGDMPYGVPFNTTQYAELLCMFAAALGVKPGILTHVIADAHIYANQMEGVKRQILNYEVMKKVMKASEDQYLKGYEGVVREYMIVRKYMIKKDGCTPSEEDVENMACHIEDVLDSNPGFKINADDPKDFYSYGADECEISNYAYMEKVSFGDVAV